MIVRDLNEYDEEEDWGDDEDDGMMPCPHCREPVFDESERCPHCGLYLSSEDAPHQKPLWIVAGVMTCLGMVIWWILHP